MFNSINGTITEKNADSVCILTGGIEWLVTVPATDISALPRLGEQGRLYTWLYHREDMMCIFGFINPGRRTAFMELIKVEGIGPKGAIKILGGIGQEELEAALENEDLARLEAVPGLGKKTAQKMILALKGRLVSSKAIIDTPYKDIAQALIEMGYDRRSVLDALLYAEKKLPASVSEADNEKFLFKEAIVYLSGL